MNIYDRNGEPMSQEAFDKIPFKKRILKAQTLILKGEPIRVLTMWDGVDMSHGEAPVPCPFTTLVHSESYPDMMVVVPDEKKAILSHEMMMGFVRAQGGKRGWRLPLYFFKEVYRDPRSVRLGWANLLIAAFVLAIQLSTLTLGLMLGSLNWLHTANLIMALVWGWFCWCAVQGLKGAKAKAAEKKRAEKERKEFENIVGPLR